MTPDHHLTELFAFVVQHAPEADVVIVEEVNDEIHVVVCLPWWRFWKVWAVRRRVIKAIAHAYPDSDLVSASVLMPWRKS